MATSPRPLRNRVTPFSDLVADPGRGLVYGNRGCLHDAAGTIRRRYNGKRWIACRLEFKGWYRSPLMQPGRFTELFFLDEATAFAAGHRPCALCRREDDNAFRELWGDRPGADAMDAVLHEERLAPRRTVALDDLPDGTFVSRDGDAHLVLGDRLLRWSPGGYVASSPRDSGEAVLLTPPTFVRILRAGWSGAVPLLHPSAVA
ncbi:MAG: hypothetical protein ABUS54_10095 [Actinomycetota bacterium]